jgi:hypothetical protein
MTAKTITPAATTTMGDAMMAAVMAAAAVCFADYLADSAEAVSWVYSVVAV